MFLDEVQAAELTFPAVLAVLKFGFHWVIEKFTVPRQKAPERHKMKTRTSAWILLCKQSIIRKDTHSLWITWELGQGD